MPIPPAGYLATSMLPGEEVTYRARPHWVMFFAPSMLAATLPVSILNGILTGWSEVAVGFVLVCGLFGGAGFLKLAERLVSYWTTEYWVTTRRVVWKRGLIRRDVRELSVPRIDSLSLDQGIIGRIFGCGTVTAGVATERQRFDWLLNPAKFRKAIQSVMPAK